MHTHTHMLTHTNPILDLVSVVLLHSVHHKPVKRETQTMQET